MAGGEATSGGSSYRPRWYAAQIQPARAHLAIQHLERQEFRAFGPCINRIRRLRGRDIAVHEPLFPGYLFVNVDVDRERWQSINSTVGVLRLVSFAERPQPLPPGFVETLEDRADASGVVSFDEDLRAGDAVRVMGGAFDDVIGTLISERPGDRVIVMLGLLSGAVPVEMRKADLARA